MGRDFILPFSNAKPFHRYIKYKSDSTEPLYLQEQFYYSDYYIPVGYDFRRWLSIYRAST
jgi:hypothetical protein